MDLLGRPRFPDGFIRMAFHEYQLPDDALPAAMQRLLEMVNASWTACAACAAAMR